MSSSNTPAPQSITYQHYRKTTLGLTLEQALADMIEEGKIPEELRDAVLQQFDVSIYQAMIAQTNKISIKGDLHTYKGVDEVYMFLVTNARIKIDTLHEIPVDKVKIITMLDKSTKDKGKSKKKRGRKTKNEEDFDDVDEPDEDDDEDDGKRRK